MVVEYESSVEQQAGQSFKNGLIQGLSSSQESSKMVPLSAVIADMSCSHDT
jgi:hypothetical protein